MAGPIKPKRKRAPARTLESRENQMISLAVDLAEKQLIDGSATAQVITHFLKLGTTIAILEKERLEKENELLRARTDALKSSERTEKLYADAIDAFRLYSGQKKPKVEEDDDY